MSEIKELEVFKAVFRNEAANPDDTEEVFLDAVDRFDAMKQCDEYRETHPFEVSLLSLEKLDE